MQIELSNDELWRIGRALRLYAKTKAAEGIDHVSPVRGSTLLDAAQEARATRSKLQIFIDAGTGAKVTA